MEASASSPSERTFELLQGSRPQVMPLPPEVSEFTPDNPTDLSWKMFTKCVREAPSASAPGPDGCTNEMLRVCLDDGEVLQLLHLAAQDFESSSPTPLPGDHCYCTVLCCRSGSSALRRVQGPRCSHQCFALLSSNVSASLSTSSRLALCGGFLDSLGRHRGGLPEVRTFAFESDCHREDSVAIFAEKPVPSSRSTSSFAT